MELRFPSPGLRAQSATLGIDTIRDSNAVGVAFSRRRYPQQDNGLRCVGGVLLNSICNILSNPPQSIPRHGQCPRLARNGRYEVTYRPIRAHVSIVTCPRFIRYEPPMMVAGDAHRPITISTQADNDIQTTESPSPTLPKGRGLFPAVSKAFARNSRPLGRVGEGLSEGRGGAYSPQKNRRADRHGWHPRLRL